MSDGNLSVFFPAFNEGGNIENTVKKATAVLEKLNLIWEIIIVDDGSKDNTLEVAEGLARNNSKIRVIHQNNGGYGAALVTGFTSARYDLIGYTDSDGQFDFSEVTKFLEAIKSADVVLGYRIKRSDSLNRLIIGKSWNFLIRLLFGMDLKDVDCGFKLFKRGVIEKISPLESRRGGMINAELAIKSKRADFVISQVGVNHYPRGAGKPTGVSLNVIINSFIDLFKLWAKKS